MFQVHYKIIQQYLWHSIDYYKNTCQRKTKIIMRYFMIVTFLENLKREDYNLIKAIKYVFLLKKILMPTNL